MSPRPPSKRPGFDLPRVPINPATWALSERLRMAKEAPAAPPLHPMLVDPRLARLTLTVEAGPPPVLMSVAIAQATL